MRQMYLFCGFVLLGLWAFFPVQTAAARFTRTLPPELATPSTPINLDDLYRQADAANQLADQFLAAMGQTKKVHPKMSIHNAQPRDIEVVSNALYDQVRALAFEYTRETYEPQVKGDSLEKSWETLNQLLRILYELQPILDQSKPLSIAQINAKTPSDLVLLLINLNEKMDDLAWFEYSPSKAFQTVTQGIYIAAVLIENSPIPQSIPPAPVFIRGKTSQENYQRLFAIMKTLNDIAKLKNIPFIQIEVEDVSSAITSDVHNLATLINAQLLYLYHQVMPDGSVMQAYYPGWKFPSHIYQRSGVLEQQINQLLHIARVHSNWLLHKQTQNG
ncbi:hypothetical protein [Legionella maioricensis]|uniref:Uncharacterized protein n=1 Tax=Legionella maioricensis TaxID=2896528 RepID=A0A9X2CZ44_9GAMM|nr:hypothetical protein [Legionella maioricensis]MCL9682962.1 hypothetical protein [Legionella maioricensis]MCL9686310.1 hypothetical protein [Legionella maioricensis]